MFCMVQLVGGGSLQRNATVSATVIVSILVVKPLRQETILHIKSLKTRYFTEVSNSKDQRKIWRSIRCLSGDNRSCSTSTSLSFSPEDLMRISPQCFRRTMNSVLWINSKSFVLIFCLCSKSMISFAIWNVGHVAQMDFLFGFFVTRLFLYLL